MIRSDRIGPHDLIGRCELVGPDDLIGWCELIGPDDLIGCLLTHVRSEERRGLVDRVY